MTLARLIEAVEAGAPETTIGRMAAELGLSGSDAIRAYNGSLDAAKRLHDALLPGWDVGIDNLGRTAFFAVVYDGGRNISAEHATSARAWLIAILRAMEGRR